MARSLEQDCEAIARLDAVPKILDVACRMTGMGFAAVARVTDRRWMACAVRDQIGFGLLPGGELKLESTICHEIRQTRRPVAFDDARTDPHYGTHHTPETYGLRSYISVPIVLTDGEFFGTLCAIDPEPHVVNTPEMVQAFELFASLIASQLDASERVRSSQAALTATETALLEERETGDLRERFIAALGHDLRNPLGAIDASALVLLQPNMPTELAPRMALQIRKSVSRMSGMIANLLDFARGRMGGGLVVERQEPGDLGAVLDQVVSEVRSLYPDREIRSDFTVPRPVAVDPGRLSQLLSNLLSNAVSHGARNEPIEVSASMPGDHFQLTVVNHGATIPADLIPTLFQPFTRGVASRADDSGLGLGLYIASEIAKAHGGELQVASADNRTRFTLSVPSAPQ